MADAVPYVLAGISIALGLALILFRLAGANSGWQLVVLSAVVAAFSAGANLTGRPTLAALQASAAALFAIAAVLPDMPRRAASRG